jgi:hypothetical protein
VPCRQAKAKYCGMPAPAAAIAVPCRQRLKPTARILAGVGLQVRRRDAIHAHGCVHHPMPHNRQTAPCDLRPCRAPSLSLRMHEHPHSRIHPACAVSHPADARHRALGGAQHSMVPTISRRRISLNSAFLDISFSQFFILACCTGCTLRRLLTTGCTASTLRRLLTTAAFARAHPAASDGGPTSCLSRFPPHPRSAGWPSA